MAGKLSPQTEEAVRARISYFRDLGVFDFYRREGSAPSHAATATVAVTEEESAAAPAANDDLEPTSPMPRKSALPLIAEPLAPVAPINPSDRAAALEAIRADIGNCTRCALHKGRNKIVFADGDPNARLMFVGEGPGADEDAQGLPFVGRAGQLLNNMINAMGLGRDQVYIANIVKCRPPQNRVPEPVEANTCAPFLFRQIDVIRPQVIVALGATAATYLLGGKSPLAALRGRIHQARGTKLIVTYHPAYLLRDPRQKKEAWADLQLAMAELGLKAPAK
ncbi:MAG TPA: uracil-DNA glycosylase [Acidobacteriaceae bacterium]|nr:uracil-DNA glycosylase [Acidobacteriaceae bacterium]